jgi:lantibiotic modifying enzyme
MQLSHEQLLTIAARGSFLAERLRGGACFDPGATSETVCRERYLLWQNKSGGNGGGPAFLKRLKLDGISPEKALEVLADPVWDPGLTFPEWVADLQAICSLFPFDSQELAEKLLFNEKAEIIPNNDMIDAVLPFVYYAEHELQKKLGSRKELFTQNALSNLSVSLIKALSLLCFPTFRYRFRLDRAARNPLSFLVETGEFQGEIRQDWSDFTREVVTSLWPEILAEYPVLARLITVVIKEWVTNITELAGFLAADAQQLAALFFQGETLGAVTGVTADISDVHNHGKCVYILEFGRDRKVAFKPRSLKIDQIWAGLLEWVNQKGIPAPFLTPRVLDFGDHGWMEYIQNIPLQDREAAGRFYFRSGVVIGLIYGLGGNDFHRENLIAWGEHPVLIDTETLLVHRVKPFQLDPAGLNADQIALDFLRDSVLGSGFFPHWSTGLPGQPPDDIGALTGRNDACGNLPLLGGVHLNVRDYQEKLLEGFRWIYDCLTAHRNQLVGTESWLGQFASCKFRFLIRNSQIYGDLLAHTTNPEYLKDGLEYSFEMERMAAAFLLAAPDDVLTGVWPVFQSESEALHRRDIPSFYGAAESAGLMDATTVLYPGYFIQTGIDRAKELIGKLSPEDRRIQSDLIENSLGIDERDSHNLTAAAIDTSPGVEERGRIDHQQFLAEAGLIYQEILAKRILGPKGDATWIVQQYDMTTQKLMLGRIGIPLYDGVLGLALFLAALYRVTPLTEIKENALKCVEPFREALFDRGNPFPIQRLPLGLGSGLAGLITVMMSLALYLDETSLIEEVRYLLHKVQPSQIENDKHYDVISGSAGLALALAKFNPGIQDAETINLARECGKHLLAGRIKAGSGHRVWVSGFEKTPLTGMGHGAAGIACALLKIYELTGNPKLPEAALEAMEYETALYDPSNRNWPDLRQNSYQATAEQSFMAGWCSGAPGIGLTRLAGLAFKQKQPSISEDIEKTIAFTLQHPMNANDHLCCGNSGRIDFLIEAGLKLDRPDLLAEARKRAVWMIQRREAKGQYTLNAGKGKVFNPSLFQGTAGIGYELLRCAAPLEIFSILN